MIFFSDLQLKYLKDAKAWYVDGTFKIVKDPFTQLLTIHTTVMYNNKTTSIPIAFILMKKIMADFEIASILMKKTQVLAYI